MIKKRIIDWVEVRREGLYCIAGNFFIDPVLPVDSALITHGHSDHAHFGHLKVLATPETISIMKARYPDDTTTYQPVLYNQPIIVSGVKVTFLPAGHIIGSAQILLEYQNKRLIFSGDYKRTYDPTCKAFQVKQCDVFITEATFGLPVFIHPPIEQELNKLLLSIATFNQSSHLVGAYALGKCQRIIMSLREMGYERPIYLHGAMIKLCELYEKFGIVLGELAPVSTVNATQLSGEIILCPPSALNHPWANQFPERIIAFASGWMQIRARAKQKAIELPLIISDHADWNELNQTIKEVDAQEVWITHGNEEGLLYYATQQGFKAKALSLLHYDEEED